MPSYKQEMPPPGGYSPIEFIRKSPKKLNGFLVLAGLYACTAVGFKYQDCVRKRVSAIEREDEENRIALSPFLVAEQERMYLKQVRRNRDYEAKLMADVPNWKVGHWHDVPVFFNPRGLWADPMILEFYAHIDPGVAANRSNVSREYF